MKMILMISDVNPRPSNNFKPFWGKKKTYNDGERKMTFKCFDPSICMKQLQALKPRSLILTSGTLSPIDLLIQDLGIDFKV